MKRAYADPSSTGPEASTEQGKGSSPELDDDPDEAADNAEPSALEVPESTSDSESADAEDPADDGNPPPSCVGLCQLVSFCAVDSWGISVIAYVNLLR